MVDPKKRAEILDLIAARGGLGPGVAADIARQTGVPEAEVYGAGAFYHLLADPSVEVRVCTGLSCAMRGGRELLERARAAGLNAAGVSCLAACDRPPAAVVGREVLVELAPGDIDAAAGDPRRLASSACPDIDWRGQVGPDPGDPEALAMNLAAAPSFEAEAFARALELGPEKVIEAIDAAGLQGRGGAGFPAATKWRGVRAQAARPRYIVLNADESEPGTFKDRDLMMQRPDLVLEGLAIASRVLEAPEVYLYLRGAFSSPRRALEQAIERFAERGLFEGVTFHLHSGHGAYICGEETAMLEALEGKRGMPRHKPPFPTEAGLWGQPTLIQNVETIACVPAIVRRGGDWFRALGKTEPGTKLYSISGDVARPGTYEAPLGVSLDELVEMAGGYLGEPAAFSPGGASSGFLPAAERTRPLDFRSLAEAGSMLGSAGVVVLNREASLLDAVRDQLWFFEVESCGQCAPCRIGTRFLRESLERFCAARGGGDEEARVHLQQAGEVAWEMAEGSICGLGQTAALPLTSAMRHFPDRFSDG